MKQTAIDRLALNIGLARVTATGQKAVRIHLRPTDRLSDEIVLTAGMYEGVPVTIADLGSPSRVVGEHGYVWNLR